MDPLTAVSWHIPHISISPASPEEAVIEPYSPFSSTPVTSSDEDAYRPRHLTPPPTLPTFGQILRPLEDTRNPEVLGRERFQALLQASVARHAPISADKAGDLRKEIAFKAHTNTQARRRAIFLSRVLAPPSPTATLTPKTPPDSPAIFHYTLPSPGLVSPLTHLEMLGRGTLSYAREPWVEQVDFRSPRYHDSTEVDGKPRSLYVRDHKGMPSLDQISARMNSQGHISTPVSTKRATRLPAFLTSPRIPTYHDLGMATEPSKSHIVSPLAPCSTDMDLSGLLESKLRTLDSRARRGHAMVSTLRRRTTSTEQLLTELDGTSERSRKRHSAPADLSPFQERDGFKHPALLLPGGF